MAYTNPRCGLRKGKSNIKFVMVPAQPGTKWVVLRNNIATWGKAEQDQVNNKWQTYSQSSASNVLEHIRKHNLSCIHFTKFLQLVWGRNMENETVHLVWKNPNRYHSPQARSHTAPIYTTTVRNREQSNHHDSQTQKHLCYHSSNRTLVFFSAHTTSFPITAKLKTKY